MTTHSGFISRRELLQMGGAAVVAGTMPAKSGIIQTEQKRTGINAGIPPLPPLEIITLNRIAFGPRPGDLDAFRALGNTPAEQFQAYIEQQLNPDTIDDSELEDKLNAAGFINLNKPLQQLWYELVVNGGDRNLAAEEMERATYMRALYSRRQLAEVLADFWHNHFSVYGFDYAIKPVIIHYDRDVIRAHMLGNFRAMLEAVAKSPAMLYFLDNRVNQVAGPNENYARELFELHTLGAENYLGVMPQQDVPRDEDGRPVGYVDNDIYEATRCFTGWRINDSGLDNTGLFVYYAPWHDRFQKYVLGVYVPPDQADQEDGRGVLNLVAAHPGTARYLARKLCRRLISDDPPDDVVAAAAATFSANLDAPDQLKQVVRTILLSDAFQNTWGEKIKRPFEFVISGLRAMGVDLLLTTDSNSDTFVSTYKYMGQPLFQWPAPDCYPDRKEAWNGSSSTLQRWRMANWLIDWKIDDAYVLDVLGQTPPAVRSPNALADYWLERLLGRPADGDERDHIVSFMAQGRNPDFDLPLDEETTIQDRLRAMVGLIMQIPSFQWR